MREFTFGAVIHSAFFAISCGPLAAATTTDLCAHLDPRRAEDAFQWISTGCILLIFTIRGCSRIVGRGLDRKFTISLYTDEEMRLPLCQRTQS